MDEARLGGVVERLRDLEDHLDRVFFLVFSQTLDVVIDGVSVDEFHHEVVVVPGLPDVQRADDVRVIQLRSGAAFVIKPLHELRIVHELPRQDLDRDDAVERDLLGFVNGRHRARAELVHDLVAGDLRRRRGGRLLDLGLEAVELLLRNEPVGDEEFRQRHGPALFSELGAVFEILGQQQPLVHRHLAEDGVLIFSCRASHTEPQRRQREVW